MSFLGFAKVANFCVALRCVALLCFVLTVSELRSVVLCYAALLKVKQSSQRDEKSVQIQNMHTQLNCFSSLLFYAHNNLSAQ